MNAASRILLGAAVGALAVLVAHPLSRPTILNAFLSLGPSKTINSNPNISKNLTVLPDPEDLWVAAIWMEEGARRVNQRLSLSDKQLDALIAVATSAAQSDIENAFWLQMRAVFLDRAGKKADSIATWRAASARNFWNDYQSARLETTKRTVEKGVGTEMAWVSARLYYARTIYCARAIDFFGRAVIAQRGFNAREDLELRFATLLNGRLLRDGSRSFVVGMHGVNMVESASLQQRSLESQTPKKLLLARFELTNAMRRVGLIEQSDQAVAAFADNEAWTALLSRDNPPHSMQVLSVASVITGALPGALLGTSLIAAALYFLGCAIEKKTKLRAIVTAPVAPILGIAIAIGLYALTELWLLSATAVLCFSFLMFGPSNPRAKPPDFFGPLFSFAMGLLAAVFVFCISVFWAGLTSPAVEVMPLADIPYEYWGGQSLPIGLAVIVLCLILLVAPGFAIAQRVSTPLMVAKALQSFGRYGGIGAATLGLALTPIALYVDTRIGHQMNMLLLNEPSYYLIR